MGICSPSWLCLKRWRKCHLLQKWGLIWGLNDKWVTRQACEGVLCVSCDIADWDGGVPRSSDLRWLWMAAAASVLAGRSPWHSGSHSQYFISPTELGLREQLCTRCKRIIKSVLLFSSFCKFPPLPPKAQVNVPPKVLKQLGEYHPLLSKA